MERAGSETPRHPRDRISAALALFDGGGPQIRDGGGDSGPPLFDAAEQGWRLDVECSFNDASARPEPGLLVYRYYVDHVGAGRRQALPMYLLALQGAGLDAAMGPIHAGAAKQVVWLAGEYDGDGRRLR
jgi:hypothetical protein